MGKARLFQESLEDLRAFDLVKLFLNFRTLGKLEIEISGN